MAPNGFKRWNASTSPTSQDMPYKVDEKQAQEHGSQAINDTWINRILILAAIKMTSHTKRSGGIMFFGPLCFKHGELRRLAEASTMQFIARHTDIPVPKIYCAFKRREHTYIVMRKVKGRPLVHGWASRSAESKAKILQQLRIAIESMRQLTPPSSRIANIDGGELYDPRLAGDPFFGPYDGQDAFHKRLRNGMTEVIDTLPSDVKELLSLHDREWPPPVFTHGDLSSLNIIANGDQVTGIIDWETSGWYPAYWEYTTAYFVNPFNEFWREEVDKFLVPYPEELRMEGIRRKYFRPF